MRECACGHNHGSLGGYAGMYYAGVDYPATDTCPKCRCSNRVSPSNWIKYQKSVNARREDTPEELAAVYARLRRDAENLIPLRAYVAMFW